jgi:exodeoxyribonuclease VII large subunit
LLYHSTACKFLFSQSGWLQLKQPLNNLMTEEKQTVQYIKLSELTSKIKRVITDNFQDQTFWVVAEISGHRYYSNNGWHYFSLVEKIANSEVAVAKINCKAWNNGAENIRRFEEFTGQEFTDGIEVLLKVKVEYHIVYDLSLTVLDLDIAYTLGSIEKQRQATLLKLITENPEFIQLINQEYITRNKNLKLNAVMQNIAVIASRNSLGLTDFVHTLTANPFSFRFSIDYFYTTVQGTEAAAHLVNALVSIHNSDKKYDAVIILRGGGAKTDFLVFDTYRLSRAVAKFPVPVITGIGHHEDVSIVDRMAHTHMKTPTKAAEFVIAHNRHFEDKLLQLQNKVIINSQRLASACSRKLNIYNSIFVNKTRDLLIHKKDELNISRHAITGEAKTNIYNTKNSLLLLVSRLSIRPKIILASQLNVIDTAAAKIENCTLGYLSSKSIHLNHLSSVINMMSPVNILKKGFAIIFHENKIIASSENLTTGSEIKIKMNDAEIISTVIRKEKLHGN